MKVEGARQLNMLVNALQIQMALTYGERTPDPDTGEDEGWKLELPICPCIAQKTCLRSTRSIHGMTRTAGILRASGCGKSLMARPDPCRSILKAAASALHRSDTRAVRLSAPITSYIADNAAWQEECSRIKAERGKEAEMLAYQRDQSIRRKRRNSERVT